MVKLVAMYINTAAPLPCTGQKETNAHQCRYLASAPSARRVKNCTACSTHQTTAVSGCHCGIFHCGLHSTALALTDCEGVGLASAGLLDVGSQTWATR